MMYKEAQVYRKYIFKSPRNLVMATELMSHEAFLFAFSFKNSGAIITHI